MPRQTTQPLTQSQGKCNGKHIKGATNKVTQNEQDYQTSTGRTHQAVGNPFFEIPLNESCSSN